MTDRNDLLKRYKEYMFPAVTPYFGDDAIVVDHAKDQWVWDMDGRQYLDFFGGVLTVSVGHANDEVTAATIEQLQKAQHTSTLYVNEIMVRVAEKVAQLTPGRLQKCYFTNSGSEANETAILAARMYTGYTDVIALRHAYSGRTTTAMSITAHGTWRLGNTFDGSIKHVRNPYSYRAPEGMTPDQFLDMCVQDVEEVLATLTSGRIAAFIAEPIQGVGGFITPPAEYFKRVIPLIKAAGGVFISDEVQTGWGRTGKKWFGIEHWGVEPDIMTFAKGMANGSPIGCTIATPEIAEAVKGMTFSTFGGNPVTMATALATIEYIEKNDLAENAHVRGTRFREALEELQGEFPWIGEVRGMGLMQAMEIVQPGSKKPDTARTGALLAEARKQGLLIGKGGLYGNVIRMSPHLNVSSEDMEMGIERLARACANVN
jgi:4-aminobutyrate aminotransferase-like enzyme